MKTNFEYDETISAEFFKLASQLYVKLRRNPGRVIDAVYMVKNTQYAQEILALAAQQNNQEINELLHRINALIASQSLEVPLLKQLATPAVIPAQAVATPVPVDQTPELPVNAGHTHDIAAHSAEEAAQHYVGALR